MPSMLMRILVVLPILVLLPLGVASRAPAQTSCRPHLPSTERALEAWQAARSIQLAPDARSLLDARLCEALEEVSAQTGSDSGQVDRAAATVLPGYLDANATPADRSFALSTLISAQLTLGSAPYPPEPRSLGVVRIRYTRQVDRLRIGPASLPPSPAIMTRVGPQSITGLMNNAVVCTGAVAVSAFAPVEFAC